MGFRFPVQAKTRQTLAMLANPELANQPEALPWVLFDTQSFTTAVTVTNNYFLTQPGDRTMGNMEGPGQLPDPQFFEIWYWGCDFLVVPAAIAAATAVGPLTDIAQFLWASRYTWQFTISNKNIGPFPLSFFHASGGPTGFMAATYAAPVKMEYANNGVFDGGYCVNGSIIIPPKLGFVVTLTGSVAPTLNQSPLLVRAWKAGVLHRRVI